MYFSNLNSFYTQRLQQQEEQNTKINKNKLLNLQRTMMRIEKTEELRKQVSVWAQEHQRQMDRKDVLVDTLVQNIDEAEEQ